jgi:hypothetical protein
VNQAESGTNNDAKLILKGKENLPPVPLPSSAP